MGKKDKKSKTAEQKARVAAKQEKKATQKERKIKSKGGADSDADGVDLEAVRQEYEDKVSAAQKSAAMTPTYVNDVVGS